MPEITFNRDDIDRLTRKLGRFATELTNSEWALLLAIFAAAAGAVTPPEPTTSGTLPGAQISGNGETVENPRETDADVLRQQLLNAYTPGKAPPQSFGDSVTPR
jgi:hypothetical protein